MGRAGELAGRDYSAHVHVATPLDCESLRLLYMFSHILGESKW